LREAHFFQQTPLSITHSHAHSKERREGAVQALERECVWGNTKYMVHEEGRAEWGGLLWLKPWTLFSSLIRAFPSQKKHELDCFGAASLSNTINTDT